MHWSQDLDAAIDGVAAGQPQHFGAVGLHGEIGERARPGVAQYDHAPTKHGVEFSLGDGLVLDPRAPPPELRKHISLRAPPLTPPYSRPPATAPHSPDPHT